MVATIRPLKKEFNKVRVTIRGDKLEHEGHRLTVLVALATGKIHPNSVMSMTKLRCMTIDLKDFYYYTPMNDYELGNLPLDLMPDEMIKRCNSIFFVLQ